MAKAKQIACEEPASEPHGWLAEVLLVRFDEVAAYSDDALKPDNVEGIHNIRVATRRLRSVLRDFEEIVDQVPARNLRRDLKTVSDLLGAVRDEDVAIAALQQFSTETEDEEISTGIESLIAERREIRAEAFQALSKNFGPKNLTKLRLKLEASLKSSPKQRGLFRPMTIAQAAREAIIARSSDLFKRGSVIYRPDKNKALHQMRIRAKRLRYAIELFSACLGENVGAFAREVSTLQDHLGEMHDCDIWIENLAGRLKAKDSDDASRNAEAWLLSKFVKKRSKEYRDALGLWVKWEQDRFAERLKASLG